MGMKICVLIIFLVLPWISRVGDWALKWTEGDEALQVIFVMLVFPVIMNATQYYIIDSFIKNQKPEHERIPETDGESIAGSRHQEPYEDPRSGSSDEIHSGDEDDAEVLAKGAEEPKSKPKESVRSKRSYGGSSRSGRKSPRKAGLHTGNKDYDPLFDGENSPTVVGSASTSDRERLMKEADSEDEEERVRDSRRTM